MIRAFSHMIQAAVDTSFAMSLVQGQIWVEPSGKIHEFKGETHGDWAIRFLNLPAPDPNDESIDLDTVKMDAVEKLLAEGWMRMGTFMRMGDPQTYVQTGGPLSRQHLTQAQSWLHTHPEWVGDTISVDARVYKTMPMSDFLALSKPEDMRRWAKKASAWQEAWIAADGTTHEIPDGQNHMDWAAAHLKKSTNEGASSLSELLGAGWYRLGSFIGGGYIMGRSWPSNQAWAAMQAWMQRHASVGVVVDLQPLEYARRENLDEFLAMNRPTELSRSKRATAKQAHIYDNYCPICGRAGCGGECAPGPARRRAAGPIPVPAGLAEKAFEVLKQYITDYWSRLTGPVGPYRQTQITLNTGGGTKVHGQPVPYLYVVPQTVDHWGQSPIVGAHMYDEKIPEIVIQFNGRKTGPELLACLEEMPGLKIQGWLHHELAHAFDKIPGNDTQEDPQENPRGYYNNAAEVKAYASQVWRYVMDNDAYYSTGLTWIQKTGEKGLWELVGSALTSYVRDNIKQFCTPQNQRYILQVTYKALMQVIEGGAGKQVAASLTKLDLMRVAPLLKVPKAAKVIAPILAKLDPDPVVARTLLAQALGDFPVTASVDVTASKTLFHGTTRALAQKIMKEGLEPQVGPLVMDAYGDDAESVDHELEPLTFAADKADLGRGVFSAMLRAIEAEGHPTNDRELAILNWGAIVVLKDGEDSFEHKSGDEKNQWGQYEEHPMQVEPGDYYSRDGVDPDYVIEGRALVRFLKRKGVTLAPANKIPKERLDRLVGWVHRVHPNEPIEAVIEKVHHLPWNEFLQSERYYQKALAKTASWTAPPFEKTQWMGTTPKLYAAAKARLEGLKFPLTLYRAVKLPNEDALRTSQAGIFWTDQLDRASFYTPAGKRAPGEKYVLRVEVGPQVIDWDATFNANCEPQGQTGTREQEIKLHMDAPVIINGIMGPGETEFSPRNIRVTASIPDFTVFKGWFDAGENKLYDIQEMEHSLWAKRYTKKNSPDVATTPLSVEYLFHKGWVRVSRKDQTAYFECGQLTPQLLGQLQTLVMKEPRLHCKEVGISSQNTGDTMVPVNDFLEGGVGMLRSLKRGSAHKPNPAADKETEGIRERAKTPEARKPHDFEAAEWTHPNGHPRCRICGDEEPISGRCNGASKTASLTRADVEAKRDALLKFFPEDLVQETIDTMPAICIDCGGLTNNCKCASFVHASRGLCCACAHKHKTAAQVPIGMNINDSQMPWTQMILQGKKTVETRNSDSLRPHVGDRVGIVRTGVGPAVLVGYCSLGEPVVYHTNEEFRADQQRNQIPSGPEWDLQPGAVKYGYPLSNVEAVNPPQPVAGQGRVFRRLAAGTPTLRVSNPGGEWLQREQEYSHESGKNQFGCPKVWGPVTATFSGTLLMPVELLATLPGMRGEQKNVRPETMDWMTESMGASNRLPQMDDQDYAPFVMVDCDGNAWVSEGNHRIMTAAKLGWPYLPVEIRYFSGGEAVNTGALAPQQVIQRHEQALQAGHTMDNYATKNPLNIENQKQAGLNSIGGWWLLPNGTIKQVPDDLEHVDMAAHALGITDEDEYGDDPSQVMDAVFAKGWIRLIRWELHELGVELAAWNQEALERVQKALRGIHGIQEVRVDETQARKVLRSCVTDFQDLMALNKATDLWRVGTRTASASMSPEFTVWFGNSKVVDAEGKPLVVIHQTDAVFSTFMKKYLGQNTMDNASDKWYAQTSKIGFWFASSEAKHMSCIPGGIKMEVFLSLQNPVRYPTLDHLAGLLDWNHWTGEKFRRAMEAEGHDGVIIERDHEVGGQSFVAFRPTQVKSVTNTGAFDPQKRSIMAGAKLFQKRADAPPVTELQKSPAQRIDDAAKAHPLQAPQRVDPTQTLEFQAWFKGSKVVDRQGRPLVVYHGSTHAFDKFDLSSGNDENFYGKGFYFTDSKVDVNSNYGTDQGKDLLSRVERRAEELMDDTFTEEDNGEVQGLGRNEALALARKEIAGQSTGTVYLTYLRMLKPVIVTPKGGTYFEGMRVDPKDKDNYVESRQLNKLYEVTLQAADELGCQGDQLWRDATDGLELYEEFTAYQFEKGIREGDEAMEVPGGPGPVLSRIWQLMGFDGIIMDAEAQFKNMNVSPGTKHYILWNPRQVKSALGNSGKFSPRSPRMVAKLFQRATVAS